MIGGTDTMWARPVAYVVAALRYHAVLVVSLVRWACGQRGFSKSGESFRYDRPVRPMVWLILGLTAGETIIVEYALPWQNVRTALLILSGYSVVFMIGMVAACILNPHELTSRELRLRSGIAVDFTVPIQQIAVVRVSRKAAPNATTAVDDGVLTMGIGAMTSVEIVLHSPISLRLPRKEANVRVIRFAADDPGKAVAAIAAVVQQQTDSRNRLDIHRARLGRQNAEPKGAW